MARYMAEIGLSPVSRTHVQARPPHLRKPWEFGREWVDPRSKFAGLIGVQPGRHGRGYFREQRVAPVHARCRISHRGDRRADGLIDPGE